MNLNELILVDKIIFIIYKIYISNFVTISKVL